MDMGNSIKLKPMVVGGLLQVFSNMQFFFFFFKLQIAPHCLPNKIASGTCTVRHATNKSGCKKKQPKMKQKSILLLCRKGIFACPHQKCKWKFIISFVFGYASSQDNVLPQLLLHNQNPIYNWSTAAKQCFLEHLQVRIRRIH